MLKGVNGMGMRAVQLEMNLTSVSKPGADTPAVPLLPLLLLMVSSSAALHE
jgi:hypothetical protein